MDQFQTQNPQDAHKPPVEEVLIGLFRDPAGVDAAVTSLKNAGCTARDLMLVAGESGRLANLIETASESAASSGAAVGGLSGSTVGLLAGATFVSLTGIGGLVAAGLMGAASGLALGSYLGAIFGARAASQEKYNLKEELAAGGAVLIVAGNAIGPDRQSRIAEILEEAGADQVERLLVDWARMAPLHSG